LASTHFSIEKSPETPVAPVRLLGDNPLNLLSKYPLSARRPGAQNAHRPWQLYRAVFQELLARCQRPWRRGGGSFGYKNKLVSLDSTVIDLTMGSIP